MQKRMFWVMRNKTRVFALGALLICVLVPVTNPCFAKEGKKPLMRNRVYRLRHMQADRAKHILTDLKIGDIVNTLPQNALIITSDDTMDLLKAGSILELLDSKLPYTIKTLENRAGLETFDLLQLAAKLPSLAIGTFSDPPRSLSKPLVLIGVHADQIIIVSMQDHVEQIVSHIASIAPVPETQTPPVAPGKAPADPNGTEATILPAKATGQAPDEQETAKTGHAESALNETNELEALLKAPAASVEDLANALGLGDTEEKKETESLEDTDEADDILEGEILDALEESQPKQDTDMAGEVEAQSPAEETATTDPSPETTPTTNGKTYRTYTLEHRTPSELAEKLTPIVSATTVRELTIVPDDRSHSLVVVATEEDHAQVADLVAQLDRAAPSPRRTQPMMSENIQVDKETLDPAQMLESMLQADETTEATAPQGGQLESAPEEGADVTHVAIDEAQKNWEVDLNLPRTIQIIDLIDMVGGMLGLNYIYDPKEISGDIVLKVNEGKIKVKDAYALLESALKFRGFVMTRRGRFVTITKAEKALEIDPTFRASAADVKPGDIVVTSIFELQHISAVSAQNLLTKMKLGQNIEPITETNTIIVTEYAYRLSRIEEILEIVDVPGEPKRFEFRQLRYTLAANLAEKVQNLAEKLEGVSVTVSKATSKPQPATRTSRSRTSRTRPPTPKPQPQQTAEPEKDTIYLDVDERTNRILMIGMESAITVVNELIDALDVPKQDLRTIQQYQIEYVGAEEVYDKLIELDIISGTSMTSRSSRSASSSRRTTPQQQRPPTPSQQQAGQAGDVEALIEGEPQVVVLEATNSLLVNATPEQHEQIATIISYVDARLEEAANPYVVYSLENQDPEELAAVLEKIVLETKEQKTKEGDKIQAATQTQLEEERITIVPDINTFSIIVYASKKNQEQIGRLIDLLDRRRPQVLLDATLVEITDDNSFNYDLDLISAWPNMDQMSGALASGLGGVDISSMVSTLEGLARDRFIEGSSTTTANNEKELTTFFGDNQIQALLTLMQSKSYGRVLAQPKILVNDNEPGSIETEITQYIARTSVTASGENSELSQESTNFEEFTSGIKLEITPHISEGDLLRLEIEMSRAQQPAPESKAANTPPNDKTENKISTVVTVPDQSTIILGGILQLNQAKGGGKVPLFGDLPIVGALFRQTGITDEKTKLYIFVKAYISRAYDDESGLPELEAISLRKQKAFERSEDEFHEYQDWPGLDAKPMEPIRALEYE